MHLCSHGICYVMLCVATDVERPCDVVSLYMRSKEGCGQRRRVSFGGDRYEEWMWIVDLSGLTGDLVHPENLHSRLSFYILANLPIFQPPVAQRQCYVVTPEVSTTVSSLRLPQAPPSYYSSSSPLHAPLLLPAHGTPRRDPTRPPPPAPYLSAPAPALALACAPWHVQM